MASNGNSNPSRGSFPSFLGSAFFSGIADGAFKVIVPLLAMTMTRSPEAIGIVAAMVWLPWPVLALFVGGIADRRAPIRVMWLGEMLRVAFMAVLVILAAVGVVNIWLFALFVFLVGAGSVAVDVPAQGVIPRLVDSADLARANGRVQMVQLGTVQLFGPPIAGYLVVLGISGSLGALSLAFLISALLLTATMRSLVSSPGADERDTPPRESVAAGLRSGMAYIAERSDIVRISVLAGFSNFAFAGIAATLPVFAVAPGPLGLSSTGYGFLFTAGAVGGVLVGFVAHSVVARIGERRTMQASVPALGFFVLLLAAGNIWSVAAGLFGYGALIMLWNVANITYRQRTIPSELLNRVNATYRWISWGAMPVGSFVGGLAMGAIGGRMYFLCLAIAVSLAGVFLAPRTAHFRSPQAGG